ncbi:glycoside hydrolase family 130 protein [Melioribacter sp. OK-6-Me]|uniref:glycoside hydrolase family 130 protein n=1 Tax=unclassified Melioribacter TaxID=2627329 RepID=UPI003ED958F6
MNIKKTGLMITPDHRRVLLKSFEPYEKDRIHRIIDRILSLSEVSATLEYQRVRNNFLARHKKTEKFFINRYEEINKRYLNIKKEISDVRKLLIGAYFSNEYSLEHSALFNPSIVPHPDQSNLRPQQMRFIMSLRATGEGHISSIVFRTGVIDENLNIHLDTVSDYVVMPSINNISEDYYEADFNYDDDYTEITLFPQTKAESNGIEDARFVHFTEDDGKKIYYATYSAYDGQNITIKLLSTENFRNFRINKIKGKEVKNKGMALFPRKINGKYVMLSRQDNENNFIMFSEDINNWETKQLLMEPKYPWEFFQIGNCGSPIETEKGWLCLSHGVGAARRYSIGAFLLDRDDPSILIGRLKEPLIEADANEREGYVPNVVYTCGALVHNGSLIIPYAVSDYSTTFAYVNLNELLEKLLRDK